VLLANPHAKLHVTVLWEPMYPGDAYGKIPVSFFTDPRVTSYWDPAEISGRWFGARKIGGFEGTVWDAVFAYRAGARWRAAGPSGLVASGEPVIGTTDALAGRFLGLLGT